MATRKKKPTVTSALPATGALVVIKPPTQAEINQALAQSQAVITDLQAQSTALTITNQQDYTAADALLHTINDGDKLVESKFRPVIELLRVPLEAIYELRRTVAVPLGEFRTLVKEKMGGYQLKEKIRLDLERAENDRKTRELQEQWVRDNPPAPTPQARAITAFDQSYKKLEEACTTPPQITYFAPPSTPAPQASHSSTRFERRVRTVDLDLLVDAATAGCLPGLTPDQCLELLTIKPSILQGHFISTPDAVAQWPGVEVYDHPIITGR
jgi:hypothetical protein